jgi:hypothetical protein
VNISSHNSSVNVCEYEKQEMHLLQPMQVMRCRIDGCDNESESDEREGEGWMDGRIVKDQFVGLLL